MCQGLVGLVVEEPGIATAAVYPLTERLGPLVSVAGHVRPAHEDVREPALREVLGSGSYDPPAELVARDAAVAIRVRRVRRDHVGRIGDEQAESFAGHGLEQVALPELHDVDPVEGGVERCERERALVHVRCDHLRRMLRREQRLDSAAGPEIEGRFHRASHGQLCERDGRRVDPRHPVPRRLPTEQIGGEVVVAMRKQPNGRADALSLARDEPERVQPVERQRPDRSLDL